VETNSTNAFGPLLVGKHFSKLLIKGDGSIGVQTSDVKQQHSGVMVNISAKVGSITDNGRTTICLLNFNINNRNNNNR